MNYPVQKARWHELAEIRRIRNFCIAVVECREGATPEIIVVIYGTAGGADEVARIPAHERHAVSRMMATAETVADAIEFAGESWLGPDEMAKPPTF